jgi:4'-phosphopantetheinyl transferase
MRTTQSNLLFGAGLPRHGQVDLWLFPVGELTDALRKEYVDILFCEEIELSKKIIIQEKKDIFISTKALLRKILHYYTNVPTSAWRFERNLFGKPYISEPSQHRNIHFNISHAKGLIACLISTSYEVGVDVENILKNRDFLGISRNVFSEKEVDLLNATSSHRLGRTFYMYWTLKEAYLKARGVGLSLPLTSFWFELSPFPRIFLGPECMDTAKNWYFASKLITKEYLLSLAVCANSVSHINVRVYRMQHNSLGEFGIDRSYSTVIPAPQQNS